MRWIDQTLFLGENDCEFNLSLLSRGELVEAERACHCLEARVLSCWMRVWSDIVFGREQTVESSLFSLEIHSDAYHLPPATSVVVKFSHLCPPATRAQGACRLKKCRFSCVGREGGAGGGVTSPGMVGCDS